MNCTACGIQLASPDRRTASTGGDCWPLCSACAADRGRPASSRRDLLRSIYAAGRSISTCSGCGSTGGELEVHFLRPLAAGGGHGAGNLILLCAACHDKVHRGGTVRLKARIINPGGGEDR